MKDIIKSNLTYSIYLFTFWLVLQSCVNSKEQEIRNCINKEFHIEHVDFVYQNNSILSYDSFRKQHDFISVVYLQDDCSPCYNNYLEWVKQMNDIKYNEYTILFIVLGNNYEKFINEVNKINTITNDFFIVMDPDFKFIDKNKAIPRWIIDASVLIDSENKIKMVGAPWLNEDMKNLFYKIISSE